MGQPVEERPGQALGSEGFRPFIEGQVARDQRSPALVALRDQLEEQLRPDFGEWNEAQFVDDQQFGVGHLFLDPQQAPLVARLHQLVDQGGGGGEADGHSFLAGGKPQAEGHMGFASAARANDILPAFPDLRFGSGIRFTHGLGRLCKLSPGQSRVGLPI